MINYDELNDILNYVCNELDDSFFLNNLYTILALADSYIDAFKNNDFVFKYNKVHLTYDEIINITREIIESYDIDDKIKNKYLNEFDNLLPTGILDFAYDKYDYYHDSHFLKSICKNRIKNLAINLNISFSYDDITTLIHEFTHYMNGYKYAGHDDEKIACLNEFAAIYFENYAVKYLKKNYNLDSNEVGFDDRMLSTLNRARNISMYSLTFIAFINFGKIDENSYKNIYDYICKIDKDNFNNEINKVYKFFMDVKKDNKNNYKDKITEYIINDLKYFIGTIFTLAANKYSNINKMIELNENMIDHTSINDTLIKASIPFNEIKDIIINHKYTKDIHDFICNLYNEEYNKIQLNVNQKS